MWTFYEFANPKDIEITLQFLEQKGGNELFVMGYMIIEILNMLEIGIIQMNGLKKLKKLISGKQILRTGYI